MCHVSCVIFVAKSLSPADVAGKRVLEVGSLDVNGSVRPLLEAWHPATYVGTDLAAGPGVDTVCNAEQLEERFGPECFDLVVCTEMLEHVRDWQRVIRNLKQVTRRAGLLLVTTRSLGFPYHAHPHDFWRFELEDMRLIFADCEILGLERDLEKPGVFAKVRKPVSFQLADLSRMKVHSMVAGERLDRLRDSDFRRPRYRNRMRREKARTLLRSVKGAVSARLGWR